MKYLSITTIWLLVSVHSLAQDNDKTINNFSFWGGFEFNMPFHEKSAWGLFAEGYIKRKDLFAQPMGWFWRLGATYYLQNGNRLSGGLAYQYNFPYDEAMPPYNWPDLRLWQEYMIRRQTRKFTAHLWLHRMRLEERWQGRRREHSTRTDGYDYYKFETTFRYMLRSQLYVSPRCGLAVYDEIHIRLFSSESGEKLMDQNRVYAGFLYALDKKRTWHIETGYMFQSIWDAADEKPMRMRINHTWRVTLTGDLVMR